MHPARRAGAQPGALPEAFDLVMLGPDSGAHQGQAREVVFLAGDLPDLGTLIEGVRDGREVHVLDMARDGLEQIATVLAGRSGVAALHVITHGAPGEVALGAVQLTQASLAAHAETLAVIGGAMAADGDILFYGCEVGAAPALVGDLAIATGADVAASNDLTGAAALGGDWELEVRAGDVTAAPVVDGALAAQYGAVLALGSTTVNFSTTGNVIDDGGYFSSYRVASNSSYRLRIDGASTGVYANPWTHDAYVGYLVSESSVDFSFLDGNVFSIASMRLDTWTTNTVQFRGYDASHVQVGATHQVSNFTSAVTLNFSGLTGITSLRMSGSGISWVFLDDITFSSIQAPPCFLTGTGIMTPFGRVAVERLKVGDAVLTQGGRVRLVTWLGHRRMNVARHRRPQDVWPVRVRRDAFAAGVPARDVVLSPDHAVFAGGVLIPVRYLVNGASVVQEAAREVAWWHVELDAHDILLADGPPAESYLDTGNRAGFDNAGDAVRRLPDAAAARAVWAASGCARLYVAGPEVVAVRAGLLARLAGLGHEITADAGLVLRGGGRRLVAERDGDWWLVAVPAGVERLVLTARSVRPAELDPASDDWRRLGVAVAALLMDGQEMALDDACFGMGWLESEGDLRWMDGEASLRVVPGSTVSLFVPPLLRYHRAAVRPGPGEIRFAAAG